eukprot:GILJ01005800.1.p1 GENE.GILJ01005800.1~~GILJ01005800.1.p1  ORF type:complete len:215 (-),score=24.09 GILJ01005800.1:65-709(-)
MLPRFVRHMSSSIRIYTRTGDRGSSSLFSGERRSKDDIIFEALGDTDELNAHIGAAKEWCVAVDASLVEKLSEIQSRLLDLGSNIATPRATSAESKVARTQFDEAHTTVLEEWIDGYDAQLPPLRNFILPSGGHASCALHIARAVCRRAERHVVPLCASEQVEPQVGKYLNRLSDFLFMAARYSAFKEQRPETLYNITKREASVRDVPPATPST